MNCLNCANEYNCTQCQSGFTVFVQDSLKACVSCVSTCETCAENLPNVCLSCGEGSYLSGNGTCISCVDNCEECAKGTCTSCSLGYFMTSSQTCSVNCEVPCATCSSTNPFKCHSCIGGYTYNAVSFSCAKQVKCTGQCKVCPIGYALDKGICHECLGENCQTCAIKTLDQCKSCLTGYHLDKTNSKCKKCM